MLPALSNQDVTWIRERLLYLAWRWHGLSGDVAEDLIQSSFESELRLQAGTDEPGLDLPLLVAILRTKCGDFMADRTLTGARA